MLQRAAETVSGDDECNDPAVLLACALGSTGCPAKCAEAEKDNNDKNPNNAFNGVVAGDLNVAVSTSSSITSIPNKGVIKVAELAVKASEDIQLQSLDITRLGLSTNEDLKVWIEKDGRRITSASSFFGDSKASLTFNNGGYVVKGDETLDLVVSLNKNTAGDELQFKVSNLVSSAKNSTISPDTTGVFRTANYEATSISIVKDSDSDVASPFTPSRSYNLANDTQFSFGEIKVQNDSPAKMEKDVMIKSITFKVDGSIENLTNFKLLRDSKEVSSKYTIDGKSLTFAVNDQLDSGKSATYKVTAEPTNIESDKGDDYKLTIKKDSDIIAEEIGSNATAYRVSVYKTDKNTDWDVISLGTTRISGGNITLTRDSSLASTVSADWGYSDVVIAKGTMKANQAVKFDSMDIALDGIYTKDDPTNKNIAIKLSDVIRRASLVIDGKTYQATSVDGATNNTTSKLNINSEIYLSKGEHKVELQISLNNQPVYKTANTPATVVSKITFKDINTTNKSFGAAHYTNGDETALKANAIVGSIKVSDVNVAEQKTTVKKVGPSEDVKIKAGNTDERVLLVGEVSNSSDKDLEVNKFLVWADSTETTTAGNAEGVLGDLYVVLGDGATSSVYPVNVSNNAESKAISIDSLSTTVTAGQTLKFELRIIPSAGLTYNNTTTTNNSFKFDVKVGGKLNGNDTTSSELKSAKATISDKATTSVVANSSDNKLIVKPGVSTKVASFNYNVKNDSVDINKVVFNSNISSTDLDSLSIDFGDPVGAPGLRFSNPTNGYLKAEFDNVVTLPVGNYKVTVYATFNDSAIVKKAAGDNLAKTISAVAFDPSDETNSTTTWATDTAIKGTATMSFNHFVAKAYPILSVKDKNTTKDNERLDINIRKSNDDANTVKITAIGGTPSDISTDGSASTAPTYASVASPNVAEIANYYELVGGAYVKTSDTALASDKTYYTQTAGGVATWYVAEGSETDLKAISLDANSATVIRASHVPGAQISSISFTVIDDEGAEATYVGVTAGSDFASLSL